MKFRFIVPVVLVSMLFAHSISAQQSLASTIDVYVFPQSGQDASQQSQDEAECYDWAVSNTGSDPFNLAKQDEAAAQQAQAQQAAAAESTQGAGAKGALGGAAIGAVVGEIADDDAGKGAAWGAAIGGISSRRKSRNQAEQASQQADAQYQAQTQATAQDLENFKKAFSVCLEAKDYLVKF